MTIEQDREAIKPIALKHFPYEKANPGQLEAIIEAVRLVLAGTKHIVIQAPTGIGKTAIATTVHRVLEEMTHLERWRTTIVTATKGLQDQYIQDDKEIYDLKGKSNYGCIHDKGPFDSPSCSTHVKRGQCSPKRQCAYVKRRIHWCKKADLRLTNTSFQIQACPLIIMGDENEANLIILDECHEIDDKIVDHAALNFYSPKLKRLAEFGFGDVYKHMQETSDYLFSKYGLGVPYKLDDDDFKVMGIMHTLSKSIVEYLEIEDEKHHLPNHEAIGMGLDMAIDMLEDYETLLTCVDGYWINNSFETGTKLYIKPVYASQLAERSLFRKAKQFIHMSATICGVEEYTKTLGITEYEYIELPNPIPIENRKVFSLSTMKVSGKTIDYAALAGYMDKLLSIHPNENGIVHTVSLALANELYKYSKYKDRLLVSKDRIEIIQELTKKERGRVVLSPSIETGLDFRGDMSRFQIWAKVPYLYLGDPLIALNADKYPLWYARKAILRMVQGCGRSVRGVTDYAKTYILDENFVRLYNQNMEMFPDWFRDSVRG